MGRSRWKSLPLSDSAGHGTVTLAVAVTAYPTGCRRSPAMQVRQAASVPLARL